MPRSRHATRDCSIPILIGPEAEIRAAAEIAQISLDGVTIEAVDNSHAAAVRAVEMGAAGKVAALMKGSLETEELLAAIVDPASNLRTARRISHVYVDGRTSVFQAANRH